MDPAHVMRFLAEGGFVAPVGEERVTQVVVEVRGLRGAGGNAMDVDVHRPGFARLRPAVQ